MFDSYVTGLANNVVNSKYSLSSSDAVTERGEVELNNEQAWDDENSVVSHLVCIGIVGIEDPVRPEVRYERDFFNNKIPCLSHFFAHARYENIE